MISAIFSDGYTIVRSHDDELRAAWLIRERATGQVLSSGFSKTTKRARADSYTAMTSILDAYRTGFESSAYPYDLTDDEAAGLLERLKAAGRWPEGMRETNSNIWRTAQEAHQHVMQDTCPVIPEVVETTQTELTIRDLHTAQDIAWLVLNNDHPGHVTVTDDDVQAANELLAYMGWGERVSSVSEDGGMVRFTVDTPVSRT